MTRRRILWWCLTTALALVSAAAVAVGAWQVRGLGMPTQGDSPQARQEVMAAAKSHTEQLCSYTADRVEAQLNAALELTTGAFREQYSKFIRDTVIPRAKTNHETAVIAVTASSVVSLTPSSATVLEFVNQTTTVGAEPPTSAPWAFRVGMQRNGTTWLIGALEAL